MYRSKKKLSPHFSSPSLFSFLLVCLIFLLTSCRTTEVIVTNIEERDANQIVVFLASKGIHAEKMPAAAAAVGGETGAAMFNIAVDPETSTEAMAILSSNGLPRKKGTNLLELFAKQGLMSTEREETIRYQAGLAEQLANTIRKMDGVLDADVELSFPPPETGVPGLGPVKKVTASVYVKHQGILEDPNSHLLNKIKLLVSGAVNGLEINDVTVVSDRSRFTDFNMQQAQELISAKPKQMISVWSILMDKSSVATFQLLFFSLSLLALFFALLSGWLVWKFYPILRKRGLKELLNPAPIHNEVNHLSSKE
jgi:type III secretion protein J